MAIKRGKGVSDTYFTLVRQYPLTHIHNDAHLAAAQNMLDELLQTDLDAGGKEYLDVLTDLVEAYEDEHESIPDVTEAEVLRELMRSHRLTQSTLAKETRIAQSTISAVLSGSRSLTKEQIIALASYFHTSPVAFLPGCANRA